MLDSLWVAAGRVMIISFLIILELPIDNPGQQVEK
jgi:hypothetical protein